MAPRAENWDLAQDNRAEALAKGVFAFRKRKASCNPTKLQKSKRRRRSASKKPEVDKKCTSRLLINDFEARESQWASERVEVHEEILNKVETKVHEIQSDFFQGVYDGLLNFVKNSQKLRENSVLTIPTAVLLTGVNMPDHSKILDMLIARLKSITPHITSIHPGQNTKQLITSLVMDFVNPPDDEEEEVSMVKRSEASFSYLEEWYCNQYSSEDRPPLVILAQDFENLSGSSLCDLITLCSRYLTNLPIVLILGVATTLKAVHRTLPQTVTSHLTINTFGSPNSVIHLDKIIEAILIDPEVPFKLSDKVLKYLVESFLYHDFSVNHFLSAYRFLLGEHLYRQPAAVLMTDEQTAIKIIQNLDLDQLSFMCRVPSFRSYVEGLEIDQQAEILTNTTRCRQTVSALVKEYFEYVKTFTAMVKVLYCLTKDLPRNPLGRHLSSVYETVLFGDLHLTSDYRQAFTFLKLINRHELETKLKLVLEEIEDREALKDFGDLISKTLVRLDEIKNLPDSVTGTPVVQSLSERFSSTPVMSSSSLNLTSGITPLGDRDETTPSLMKSPKLGTPMTKSGTPMERTTRNSPSSTPATVLDRITRNSPMKKDGTPTERTTRNSPLKTKKNVGTPLEKSSPLTQSTPRDSMVAETPTGGSQDTPGLAGLGCQQTPASSATVSSPFPGRGSGKVDRWKLSAGLRQVSHVNSHQQTRPYDKVRAEFMEALHNNFVKYLKPPTTRPLHEIFTFTNINVARDHLTGTPRAALHAALTDPHRYLENPDLKISDPGEIPAALPDLSIAYKLHLECPRLINIYDWLSCWHSIVTGGEEKINKKDQARFTRTVSELQHLGFIKSSNRKTDHVARLTFGGS